MFPGNCYDAGSCLILQLEFPPFCLSFATSVRWRLTYHQVHLHEGKTNGYHRTNKTPTNWWGRQNAAPLKFDPEPSEAGYSAFLGNSDKCQREAACDVISGVFMYPTVWRFRVNFGDSGSNRSRDILLVPYFVTNDEDDTGRSRSSHKQRKHHKQEIRFAK